MGALQKILVVDDGRRDADRALSAELAELGYASVTTSLEATEEVLAVIPAPAAILLQMPARRGAARDPGRADRASFVALAERLRAPAYRGVPVIVLDRGATGGPIDLQSRIGSRVRVLNEPEL